MATIPASQFFGGQVPPPPAKTIIDRRAEADTAAAQAKSANSPATLAKETVLGVGKTLAQDIIGTGQSLGESAAATNVTKNVNAGQIGLTDTALRVLKQIHADRAAGKDTSRLEQAYNGIAGHSQENDIKNMLPTLNKTNLDAVLEAVGVGADLLSGGAFAPGKEATIVVAKAGLNTAKKAASSTGAALKTVGEKSTGLGVTMEVPTRQALQSYQATQPTLFGRVKNLVTGATKPATTATPPITEANTAVRLLQPGTEWQLGVHAKAVSGRLWSDTIAPALNASKNVNDMPTFLSGLRAQIIKGTADLDRRKVLLKAWQSFADDYKNVRTFSDTKLQDYKEGWARFVPEKTYKGEPIAAASKEVRALAADAARNTLYRILPDNAAKQAYIDYGNLKSIAEAGIKSVDALRSKGVSKQVWEAVMDKAVTPIATISGKILYKTGEGLEFLGNKGARKVRDIIQPR
jgi:hypothetical protein